MGIAKPAIDLHLGRHDIGEVTLDPVNRRLPCIGRREEVREARHLHRDLLVGPVGIIDIGIPDQPAIHEALA